VATRAVNRGPTIPTPDNNYFYLDYLLRPLGIWEPIGWFVVFRVVRTEH
jgi:hypothetical protein